MKIDRPQPLPSGAGAAACTPAACIPAGRVTGQVHVQGPTEHVERPEAHVADFAADTAGLGDERDADFARGWAAGLVAAAFRLESAARAQRADGEMAQSAALLLHARAIRALAGR